MLSTVKQVCPKSVSKAKVSERLKGYIFTADINCGCGLYGERYDDYRRKTDTTLDYSGYISGLYDAWSFVSSAISSISAFKY